MLPAAGTLRDRGAAGYALFCAILCALLMAVAAYGDTGDEGARTWLVFLGVLPLANAVFDFLSIGLTRWLLREGVRAGPGRAFLFGLADLGAALVSFTALGCALVAMIAAMNGLAARNPASEGPWLDLARLFADLRLPEARGDYIWLYAMIFSTFLPTFAHFSVATFSLIGLAPQGWRDPVAAWLTHPEREKDWLKSTAVVLACALLVTFSIVAPLALALWGVANLAPGLGEWYLWLFERFAALLVDGIPWRPMPPIFSDPG